MRKPIEITGAKENNLQNIDVKIPGTGLTVVTGVSGSGKSSLVFNTLYHEARRRFLDIFSLGSSVKLAPAHVESMSGLAPAVAVDQNVLNRNPHSTLATASGLHPFFRILYSNFGEQYCPVCGTGVSVLTEDEIVDIILKKARKTTVDVIAPLVHKVKGSHKTLLQLLHKEFNDLLVDGQKWIPHELNPDIPHDIDIKIGVVTPESTASHVKEIVTKGNALGVHALKIENDTTHILSMAPICITCGTWLSEIEPKHFHMSCIYCNGKGCTHCQNTGLHPQAAAVQWHNLTLPELLQLSVDDACTLFGECDLPQSAHRLLKEINTRLTALCRVGLGYITLDRPSPSVSRGEAQRVRLAVILTSCLEDMVHVLDEPTIGQHPYDVNQLLPAFKELPGPVIFVEHDRQAAAFADYAVDLGPGAGKNGGKILFTGTPNDLWKQNTPTGSYFSYRKNVIPPEHRPPPQKFLTIEKASLRNLNNITVSVPLHRLTVITGVSGSGKSTFLDVLVPSLKNKTPSKCKTISGPVLTPVLVDQTPIGRNPRSNPATYTKLSDIIRELFSAVTGLSISHFSFNRKEGWCPECKGMGAVEVKMRYLPSTWVLCDHCEGARFSQKVLNKTVPFNGQHMSIADFYQLRIEEALHLLKTDTRLRKKSRTKALHILKALYDVGLGYLPLGQPSPTLSGGEAQRVKLARHLGSKSLSKKMLILDEPSTGLHPKDISGLLHVLDRLVCSGGTVVIVEHNTDIIKAADWVIDLGPKAGKNGGNVIYTGEPQGLLTHNESLTGHALKMETEIEPVPVPVPVSGYSTSQTITVSNATANNLKSITVDIPKNALTVVTGVSGSGKSSLVNNVLESEAKRRFLESLSMYERQSTKEGPEAPVESISGLGVVVSLGGRKRYSRRATIGKETELIHHLTVLLAFLGERTCEQCGTSMIRKSNWECPECQSTARIANPREFYPSNWLSACPKCQGIGTISIPNPKKLVIHPENPICDGALYSPGYFPYGYMCKPSNMYYIFKALAKRYNFDPEKTPWNEMSKKAQNAFLFGDQKLLQVEHKNKNGKITVRRQKFPGFYTLVGDWDQFGTYVDIVPCPECKGATLRPEFLAVTLKGYTIHELGELPLSKLYTVIKDVKNNIIAKEVAFIQSSWDIVMNRLHFLIQVGLGYIHLNRVAATVSAGEAERIKLAGILGSELTSLTVLLDEPSRGLHPSEVGALTNALQSLKNEGNTVVVVEHDPVVITAADYIIDLGPKAGKNGGEIVAQGTIKEVSQTDTITGKWLRGECTPVINVNDGQTKLVNDRRTPYGHMVITGACANNLKGEDIEIPLGVIVGVCGVSGSGKSTLIVDTVGRALVPKKHTTSVAHEPIIPGEHKSIHGPPDRVIMVDQATRGISTPLKFLNLESKLRKIYAESEDAHALGIDKDTLKRNCTACKGRGTIKMDMGFLPSIVSPCDACNGTGFSPQAWDIKIKGVSLPELVALTIDEVYELFKDSKISHSLKIAKDVGLGYLVLQQPAYSLSGGETQRLKIVKELSKKQKKKTLYILDEPTVGQHLEDVNQLIQVLHRLVDAGNSVIVVEHNPYVLAACDYILELGPEGGPEGGYVIGTGTPEDIIEQDTITAQYINEVLQVVP
ncbi:MAG: ATP-binding cassette domain-containing protein [Candidatus Methanofastidiosia archaeon]|jgi:excinuclease ABC subunit A